ncbi:MAG: ATP synthase F1 subunit epsilon [Bacteroidales bacterium]|nr:ATP synthase F1 subunit epsilon [Bacteroidales bacterium]
MVNIEIITPEKRLYQGKVKLVKVPGSKGSFEILHNHAPIISTLDKGTIKIVSDEDGTVNIDIEGGIIEVMSNNIIVLAGII